MHLATKTDLINHIKLKEKKLLWKKKTVLLVYLWKYMNATNLLPKSIETVLAWKFSTYGDLIVGPEICCLLLNATEQKISLG